MNNIKTALFLIVTVLFLYSCGNSKDKSAEDLELLTSWITGAFSSEEQSTIDTNFYNIHLHMSEIWTEHNDGKWLYVEQAASWSLDKPYRQRIYRLTAKEKETFESAVYTFNNPEKFIGAWINNEAYSSITQDSIILKEGCSIFLKKDGNKFVGSTIGKNCSSELRGASYATSEVVIDENTLTSLDRGFNENGEQVWGAETGPYIFKKVK
jgi:hypothetical protein